MFICMGINAVAAALFGTRNAVLFSGARALVLSADMLWGRPENGAKYIGWERLS